MEFLNIQKEGADKAEKRAEKEKERRQAETERAERGRTRAEKAEQKVEEQKALGEGIYYASLDEVWGSDAVDFTGDDCKAMTAIEFPLTRRLTPS